MRSPDETSSANARYDSTARAEQGARWLWWSVLGGVVALILFVVIAAVLRGHEGERNRGPADEAAPGAEPSRDIERSRNR